MVTYLFTDFEFYSGYEFAFGLLSVQIYTVVHNVCAEILRRKKSEFYLRG